MRAVNAAFPDVEFETWAQCERLLPQALAASQYIEQHQLRSLEAGRLLDQTASYLQERARYTEAEPLYQRALTIHTQALALEHPYTAETMHDFAQFWEVQGTNEEASVWYTRALVIREQALGAQHPMTRQTRTRLIALLHALEQHEQAAQLEMAQVES
jgi:hypothetical protein